MSDFFKLHSLKKTYLDGDGRELKVLDDVSYTFQREKTVAIVGPSGAGKSTLLHLLGGLDRPTTGKVVFEGKDIFSYSKDQLAEWRNQKIGFVFQFNHLLPNFTALENVMMPLLMNGVSASESEKRAEEMLNFTSMGHRLTHKPGTLSGGEQQRVAISRALVHSPPLILADEPTGNLDEDTGNKIWALLQKICTEKKATLLMVTHNRFLASQMDLTLELSHHHLNPKVVDPTSNLN